MKYPKMKYLPTEIPSNAWCLGNITTNIYLVLTMRQALLVQHEVATRFVSCNCIADGLHNISKLVDKQLQRVNTPNFSSNPTIPTSPEPIN